MNDQPGVAPASPPTSVGRRRAIIGAAVAAAVILVGALVFALTRDNNTQDASGSSPGVTIAAGSGSSTTRAGGAGTTKPGGSSPTTRKAGSGGSGSPTTGKGTAGSTVASPTTGKPGVTVATVPRPPGSTVLSDIAQAYSTSFNARCVEIWSHAGPDGELSDALDPDLGPYLITDCTSTMDPSWGELMSDNVVQARQQGIDDANQAVSDLIESGRLRNTAGYIYDLPQ